MRYSMVLLLLFGMQSRSLCGELYDRHKQYQLPSKEVLDLRLVDPELQSFAQKTNIIAKLANRHMSLLEVAVAINFAIDRYTRGGAAPLEYEAVFRAVLQKDCAQLFEQLRKRNFFRPYQEGFL